MVSISIFNSGVGTTDSFENLLPNKKSSSPEKKKKNLYNDLQKFRFLKGDSQIPY